MKRIAMRALAILAGSGACVLLVPAAIAQGQSSATPPVHIKEDTRPPIGYARPPLHVRPEASSKPPAGAFTPARIQTYYGIPQNGGAGVTIGIVDAYDNPRAEADLGVFSSQFSLPQCTTANGCFRKIPGSGTTLPKANQGWALEISLDVQWAHAVAPYANILLVEAASNSFTDLMAAVDKAVANGASVVSMSFGGGEFSSETGLDSHFCNKTGVVFFASSGDSGFGAEYPSASPCVISVGGTTASVNSDGTWKGEIAWSGSGGGISAYELIPSAQQQYFASAGTPLWNNGKRETPDVAYAADPNTGFAVYDSYGYQGQRGWFQVGGTSAGSPQWAALYAIADSSRIQLLKPKLTGIDAVYSAARSNYASYFYDIVSGSSGNCGNTCNAQAGYDLVTGLGSPNGANLNGYLVGYTP